MPFFFAYLPFQLHVELFFIKKNKKKNIILCLEVITNTLERVIKYNTFIRSIFDHKKLLAN